MRYARSNKSMMTRKKLINYCLSLPLVYEDYPFDEVANDKAWTVMRHKTNKKSFALIYKRNGKLCVNVKCAPIEAYFLRQAYTSVTPAYHMNKEHWNTIIIGGDVPEDELKQMINKSYDLIKPIVK